VREFQSSEFDPRAWNLIVCVALLAGCSAPPLADDGDGETRSATESDASTSGTDTSGTDTSGTDATETDTSGDGEGDGDGDGDNGSCVTDADCVPGDYGPFVCEYGWCVPGWECLWEYHCEVFELCPGLDCVAVGEPPPSCGFDEFQIPTIYDPDAPPLALSFVDVDDDGQDEIVVATEMELLVYEYGEDVPSISPREMPSASQTSMVAGQFDAQPGEDVTLLVNADYHRYFSDSVASLVLPIIEPAPLLGASSLLAGEFDGQAPNDLLLWHDDAATLDIAGAPSVPLAVGLVTGAIAFDYDSPAAGLVILNNYSAVSFDFLGGQHESVPANIHAIVGLATPDGPRLVTAAKHDADGFQSAWYELGVRDATNLGWQSMIVLADAFADMAYDPSQFVAGDFDGDQSDDIFVASAYPAPVVQIVFGVLTQPCLATQDLGPGGAVSKLVVGDHDGDGDAEVALLRDGVVMLLDIE
jgi:hypothetical protein